MQGKKLTAFAVAALVGLAGLTSLAGADDENPAIKYRQAVMKANGWHIGPIAGMAKGEMAFDNASLTHHAEALAALAKMTLEGFPEGSEGGKAKAEAWSNRADFEAKAQAFIDATAALAAAAPTVQQADLGALLGAVGGACKGCHENYRAQ